MPRGKAMENPAMCENCCVDESWADFQVRQALCGKTSTPVKCDDLRAVLKRSHDKVANGHREMTTIWGSPLSLFDADATLAATNRGIPDRTIATVRCAKNLVEEASYLADRTDAYDAQVTIALREQRGLRKDSLLCHLNALEDLAGRLKDHLPKLQAARLVFDLPDRVVASDEIDVHDQPVSPVFAPQDGESAAVILEPRKKDLVPLHPKLKKFLNSVQKHSQVIVPKALNMAIDAVDAVCIAAKGGRSEMSFRPLPEMSTGSASRMEVEVSREASVILRLGLEDIREKNVPFQSRRARAPADATDPTTAMSRWERCRSPRDRRWTIP